MLGRAESAGLRFDHLWLAGLAQASWPPVPEPNPLLPLAVQRRGVSALALEATITDVLLQVTLAAGARISRLLTPAGRLPLSSAKPAALFLFNLGVEIGQLAVVAAGLALAWLLTVARIRLPRQVAHAPLYAIGALSAYWFVARTAAIAA